MGRAVERHPLPDHGTRFRYEGVIRAQPRAPRAVACAERRRIAPHRPAERLGRRRDNSPKRTPVRRHGAARHRPSHRRTERLLARPGGRDHAGHRGVPREVERLERHRLQLPRRPLRHRVRRALRRERAECRRSARARVQHRIRRRRSDRNVFGRGGPARSSRLSHAPPRLASRSRPRRSAVDALVHLRRERTLRCWHSRVPARSVGASRHGAHSVPGRQALRPTGRSRRRDAGARLAEAVRARRCRRPGRTRTVSRPRVGGAAVERERHGLARRPACIRQRHWTSGRLDLGRIPRHRAGRSLADRRGRRNAGRGCARPGDARHGRARHHRACSRPRDDQPQ